MQQDITLKRYIIRNSYLLIIAAWLVTISFIIDNYWSGNSSVIAVQKNLSNYIHDQEKDFDALIADSNITQKIVSGKYDEPFLQQLISKKYFFYMYLRTDTGHNDLLFWNTQTVQPDEFLLTAAAKSGFIKLANGYYAWRKTDAGNNMAIALIPVKWNYIITNEYLANRFVIGENIEDNYDIAEQPTTNPVKSIDGSTLFYLTQKATVVIKQNNPIAAWLKILAGVCILFFLHFCAVWMARYNKPWKAILFLFLSVVIVRTLSYILPIPLNFRQFELFDPSVYGSNIVLRSLGDLLINTFLFLWVVLFARYQLQEKNYSLKFHNDKIKWLILIASVCFLLTATFISGYILRTMVADSQISFDVINFFTLNSYSFIGFVVLCCTAMGYFFSSLVILHLIRPLVAKNFIILYLTIAIAGLLLLTVRMGNPGIEFELYLLIWLILYVFLSNNPYLTFASNKMASSRLVFWLFFFSLSITFIIVTENKKKEWLNRQHYAETLSSKADPGSETLMNTLLTGFRNDFLAANFERFRNDTANRLLKDSLVNGNFSGYTNKYNTKVFTFNEAEQPLFNEDSTAYNTLNTVITTQAKATSITDLFYYDESYDRFSYICKKTVTDTAGKPLGFVFILAARKAAKTDAPYPELFGKGQRNSIENSPVYSFAIYNKLQLISSHNDYAFATKLFPSQLPKEEFQSVRKKGYDELWYKAGPEHLVIIAKPDNTIIESITLFSYLFCSFLLVAGFFWLLNMIIRSRFNKASLRSYWQLSIRNQVHGTVIVISFISFLVIGIATILFFISRYENNNREKLSRTIRVMENEVRTSFNEVAMFDDVIRIYDSAYRQKLEQTISRISEIHAADINVYDIEGNLQASSLPLPYNKGIVSTRIDPVAYYHLNKLKEVQFFKDEKIGNLNFVSNYVPVLDESGRDYAYLNIPYFTSESKLKQEISNFLVTIINLNAFIFLIAGIIALFITNRITNSFSFISNKMKEVNLGKMNEVIEWNRNDEIGELVKEYNKMVGKLDESAATLAKSEREGAWREMARQVAHEIKNPLTPMKLSLQYLQKSITENLPNSKELTANVARTLVEQIDHLSQIAGEFSQFANIGNPKNEAFDLHEPLRTVTLLYSSEERVEIRWTPVASEVIIHSDKTHINRLFTNLIQNALQAVPENKKAIIEIKEVMKEDNILITVKDNGIGIPEELKSKIFTPNFTTKTSGTGLGLAMCKGIVEQAKGKIWFEPAMEGGTIFYIELPVESIS